MASGAGVARSNYRGLRIIYTQAPGSARGLVTLSAKHANSHWSDWASLMPAVVLTGHSPQSTRDALLCLRRAVDELLLQYD